jgi:hypothetical protein
MLRGLRLQLDEDEADTSHDGFGSETCNDSINKVKKPSLKLGVPIGLPAPLGLDDFAQSYNFSDSGTLNVQGFQIKNSGIKATPFQSDSNEVL